MVRPTFVFGGKYGISGRMIRPLPSAPQPTKVSEEVEVISEQPQHNSGGLQKIVKAKAQLEKVVSNLSKVKVSKAKKKPIEFNPKNFKGV